jgi:hypothetical protein
MGWWKMAPDLTKIEIVTRADWEHIFDRTLQVIRDAGGSGPRTAAHRRSEKFFTLIPTQDVPHLGLRNRLAYLHTATLFKLHSLA